MFDINSELLQKSTESYGKEYIETVCMEECSELAQAVSKQIRFDKDIKFFSNKMSANELLSTDKAKSAIKDHIAEEICDVLISVQYLMLTEQIPEEHIQYWINLKEARLKDSLKKRDNKFVLNTQGV